jgi:hypothetical protein
MVRKATENVQTVKAQRLTAFHEAGHAVMAELCGRHVTEVEIVGDREHAGTVRSLALAPDPVVEAVPEIEAEEVERQLKIMLAGLVAETIVSGREEWDESSEDLDVAVRFAMRLVDDCEDVLPLLEDIRAEVEHELRLRWPAVETVAWALMQHKSLSGTELRKLLAPTLE